MDRESKIQTINILILLLKKSHINNYKLKDKYDDILWTNNLIQRHIGVITL